MNSEKLNEERELVENISRERAIGNDRARPETTKAENPTRQENIERPSKLARVRIADLEAKDEDEVKDTTEADKPTKLADWRNLKRVDKADEVDRNLLSKCYLPETIDEFLPRAIPGPDDSFVPPTWLMKAIKEVAESKVVTPQAPPIRFDLSKESVEFNSELLTKSDLDLEKFLAKNQETTLNFGSEFRPIGDLEKILGAHPNFTFFSGVLANGMDYRFKKRFRKTNG